MANNVTRCRAVAAIHKLLNLLRSSRQDGLMEGKYPDPQRPDVIAEQRGGDLYQGMTGEPAPGDASLQQATFWCNTYAEILEMEEAVMARVHLLMSQQSPLVRAEVELSNVPVIAAQLNRFRHRHEFWLLRALELEA